MVDCKVKTMKKLFNQLIKSERGSILPMFAVVVVVLLIVMAAAIDFARFAVASEKLKTATESAANAGALTGERYVRVEIYNRKQWDSCCSKDKEGNCKGCCRPCGGSVIVEGPEDKLIKQKGYKKHCCGERCQNLCKADILSRWVVYEDNGAKARSAAYLFFDLNKPKEMAVGSGGESNITSIDVYNKGSELYPSVVVSARGKLKTLMLSFMDKMYPGTDLSELESSNCSQGGTFYYDADGKMHKAAPSAEGCQ